MSTEELRASFLVQGLFVPGEINLRQIDLDRVVLGGVVPTSAPLDLPNPAELLAQFFCERRELGVLNIGGAGNVEADRGRHAAGNKELLLVSRRSRAGSFGNVDPSAAARL